VEHPLEKLLLCPSCRHTEHQHFSVCKDFSVSDKAFTIDECMACGLRFTNPRPAEHAIGPYYDSPEYVSHNDTSKGLLFTVYQAVKKHALQNKAGILASHSMGKSLLEYGAGTGDFAGKMHGIGWNVLAYEPDSSAMARIASKHPNVVLTPNIDSVPDASRSAITLWHVLEHVHQLDETLANFHRILKKDGCLIVAVPNCSSFDSQFYSEHWAAYDVPRHLYHFRPADLQQLLAIRGFTLVEKKPMWLDSYYVSLLSENYLRSNAGTLGKAIGWIRALAVGTVSNLKCLWNTDACSSIIYILKKA
jgi:SAM-dependent methyltransferase